MELAAAIALRLRPAGGPAQDFRFESADNEAQPTQLLEFGGPQVTVSSTTQRFAQDAPLVLEETIAELKRFLPEVIERCRSELSLNATPWIVVED